MKRLIAITVAASLLGINAGWFSNEYLGYKGLRLVGQLTTKHFRPVVAGGCVSDESKNLAFREYAEKRTSLASIIAPAAYAALGDLGCRLLGLQVNKNLIVNAGETALRDCFNANASSECTATIAVLNFHGLGTSSTAAGESDTGCLTELTTEYQTDNTRATGSQATNGANVYRTVGTNTVDEAATAREWCLHKASTGAVTMWSRVVFSDVSLSPSDSLQTTYDLTIE